MMVSRSRIPTVLALIIGVFMGWALASFRPVPLHASAGDRSGESIVATGPVLVRYDEAAKGPVALDAVYFLDYKGGRLLATVPAFGKRPRRPDCSNRLANATWSPTSSSSSTAGLVPAS